MRPAYNTGSPAILAFKEERAELPATKADVKTMVSEIEGLWIRS
jgi:hypothetical protein